MKTSTLLKRAEKYLWDGIGQCPDRKTTMLCYAIDATARSTRQWEQRADIENTINSRIQGATYTIWAVREKHLPANWQNAKGHWLPIIQFNRLNWLRKLQREYRAKGD